MPRLPLCLVAAFLLLSAVRADEDGFTPLLNKDLGGWKAVPESAKDTFALKKGEEDAILVVSGKPLAYLHSDKIFQNYILRYDWKAPKEGQSGLLLHITGPHKIWPRCVQAQAREGDQGRLFTMGGAEGRFSRDSAAQRKAVKDGAWNSTEVIATGGKLTVKINGLEVATGESGLKEGYLGFQSEGTEYQFKNIRIKVLK